ncbi:MAG: hypothetical protein M1813_007069 [Trichoglossum hirsutum]|nr:MAG: hypothetical protein M1813_007069 [Trichoglossum hirsutum]
MAKAGRAAPRNRNATPAQEQEVRGVDNPPQLLGHMGSAVANAVGSFAYSVRFRRVSPLGQPVKDSITKTLLALVLPLRIDVFPWFDLDDPDYDSSPFVNDLGLYLDADDDMARLTSRGPADNIPVNMAPPNRRTDTKKSNIPRQLSFNEWVAREWIFHDSLTNIAGISTGLLNGLEVAHGYARSDRYITDTTYDLEEYARSQPSPIVEDCRHMHHAW